MLRCLLCGCSRFDPQGYKCALCVHGVLKSYVRPKSEIGKAEKEFWDRVWYYRKLVMFENIKVGKETIDPEILKGCKASMKEMRKIVTEHLVTERPVERLLLADECLNTKICPHQS